jgi:hypothetical protein
LEEQSQEQLLAVLRALPEVVWRLEQPEVQVEFRPAAAVFAPGPQALAGQWCQLRGPHKKYDLRAVQRATVAA